MTEAAAVVGEAVQLVAAEYVLKRGADRVFNALVEEILVDELRPLAADAQLVVVYENLLSEAMGPLVREVSVGAAQEARGAAARRREADERALVAQRAAEGLFERLCLQRFLQHIATSGEVLLLQCEAAHMLDELLGEGLARRALMVGQEHATLQGSAVLGYAHEQIAYKVHNRPPPPASLLFPSPFMPCVIILSPRSDAPPPRDTLTHTVTHVWNLACLLACRLMSLG